MITGIKIYEAEQYKAPKNTYGKGHLEIIEILSKTKILNDDRDAQEMRLRIKKYLYDVAIVTNNLQTKLAA